MFRSPFVVFVSVWTVTIAVTWASHLAGLVHVSRGVSLSVAAALALSFLGWGVGELLVRCMVNNDLREPQSGRVVVHRGRAVFALATVFVLSCVGFVSFLAAWSVADLVAKSSLPEAFLLLNRAIAEEESSFGGLFGRLYVLPVIGLSLTAYLAGRGALSRFVAVAIGLTFLLLLVSPRRALLLQGMLLAAIVYTSTRSGSRRHIFLGTTALCVIVVFSLTQVVLGKSDESWTGLLSPVAVYVAANIPTMVELMYTHHFADVHTLLNVPFRALNALLEFRHPVELDVPFVDVGAYSNTVPFQYYILRDIGLLGVFTVTAALGFVAQLVNWTANRYGTFGAVWSRGALLIFILFSFREFTLITYNWIFFFVVALAIGRFIHPRLRTYES